LQRDDASTKAPGGGTAARFARDDRPLVWAHRGASRQAPENTLAAFLLAEKIGADGVELDAQLCGTGEVVVLHDESLGRTTGFAGLIGETPWKVVRTLDAGARFSPSFAGERVPLLEEVLGQTKILVNLEIKCDRRDDRGLTAACIGAVRRTRAEERVLLSSFNPWCLLRARAHAPRLPRALLFERNAPFALRHGLSAPALGLAFMHPDNELATSGAIARWRRRGYGVSPWTIDDPLRAHALRDAGVTGIITNVPDRMLAAFRT
jgi:glycerophosphoryl diester phosphodiesterase